MLEGRMLGDEEWGCSVEESQGSRLTGSSGFGLSLEKQQRGKCVNDKGGNYPPRKQLHHAGRNPHFVET